MEDCYQVLTSSTIFGSEEYIFQNVTKELQREQKEVFLPQNKRKAERLEKKLKNGDRFLIVNLVEGGRCHADGKSIYSDYSENVLPYITRHPMYFEKQLKLLNPETKVYASDRGYCEYIEKYFGLKTELLPICGLERRKKSIPWENRKIEVFFPGSYLDEKSLEIQIKERLPKPVLKLCMEVSNEFYRNQMLTLEEACRKVFETKNLNPTDEMIQEFLGEYGYYAEEHANRRVRSKIIRALLKEGIKLTVCGANWETFKRNAEEEIGANLIIIEKPLYFKEVLELMGESKIVLNVATGLRDGLHERVTSAMMNGAVCFTEETPYAEDFLDNHKNVELYRYHRLVAMTKRIREILENDRTGTAISKQAVKCAQEKFTVSAFVEKLQ